MKKMVISTICVIFIMLLPVCYANNIVLSNDINNQTNKFEVVSSYSKISTMKEKLNNVKKYEDVTIDIQEELNKTTEQILFGN